MFLGFGQKDFVINQKQVSSVKINNWQLFINSVSHFGWQFGTAIWSWKMKISLFGKVDMCRNIFVSLQESFFCSSYYMIPGFYFCWKISIFSCVAQRATVNWPIQGNIRGNLQFHTFLFIQLQKNLHTSLGAFVTGFYYCEFFEGRFGGRFKKCSW